MNVSEPLHKNVGRELNLDNLYSALVECFSVILCGYAAGRLNLISQRETKGLDVFVRSFSLPSVIFLSLAQLDMSSVNWKFLASILVSKSLIFVTVIIVTTCLIRPIHFGKLGLYLVFCTQSNDFALGYPILNALYGEVHPDYPSYIYLLAPISLAVLNPIVYVLLEIGKIHEQKELNNKIKPSNEVTSPKRPEMSESGADIISPEETVGRNLYSQREENLLKSSRTISEESKSGIKLFGTVFLNVVTNPVMLMTVLGIIGNFCYHYIKFVAVVLKAFATAFSTTALFVLGLRMVGTVHKLKVNNFVTPGILIITKLLVLPLITREIVSLLRPGSNANDTLDLSTFGFIYGTFPSAPMVFVLSNQYNVEVEVMSSSLVVCTFISAPLMYISAKMVFLNFLPSDDYYQKLESFGFNIGIVGLPLGVWLIILFLANKSFSKVPHKITGFLIISQVVTSIGVLLATYTDHFNPWFAYFQFCVFALGVYSSRLWTCVLGITLVVLQSRSLCFVIKLFPFFICIAWGLPILIIAVVCLASFPEKSFASLTNPNFRHGMLESLITLILLLISFVGTSICLILQHRYRKRFAKYLVLVKEVNSRDLQEVNETNMGENSEIQLPSSIRQRKVVDIEEIVSETGRSICDGSCEDGEGLCSSKFNCTDAQRGICEETLRQYKDEAINDELDEDHQDQQILRHIVLLLFLVTSMFVNLMLSIWTLVVDDVISGVYIELLFLNVILNTGQIYVTFAVFGFDSRGLFITLINSWRKFYYGAETVVLKPIEELGFETTHVCHQFIAHHLRDCESEIATNKRLRLRMYKHCFKGKTLVVWLQTKRLAKDETEAVHYASHLLEGRVLRHVESRHHFENSDLLYTFKQ